MGRATRGEIKKNGKWFIRNDLAGTMDHEIGHARHHAAIGERLRSDEMNDPEWLPFHERIKVIKATSGYAGSKPSEFVAEVYSALVVGRTFPKWIMDLYDRYEGPRP